jgi:hypothetical protein
MYECVHVRIFERDEQQKEGRRGGREGGRELQSSLFVLGRVTTDRPYHFL